MKEYPLLTKKTVRSDRTLLNIQKASCKMYRQPKGHFPKARIGKVIRLRDQAFFYDFTEDKPEDRNLIRTSREDILNQIEESGICGLSGSGFPTIKKLRTVIEAKTKDKYLIINGVECDPGLIHDKYLLKNNLKEIEQGIELLTKCINFKKIILAVMGVPVRFDSKYDMVAVPNRYPMGAERILINEVLGIPEEQDEIPAAKGILILNIQTIYAIFEAVYKNRKADSKFITVANLLTGDGVVARVKLDSTVQDIAARISKTAAKQSVYYGGGLMSGRSAGPDDRVTAKTNFIGYGRDISPFENHNCKKCGACARKCPMNIKVNKIVQGIEKNNTTNLKEFHPERCIQCGSCTYYCHAGKNTMELVASLKEALQQRGNY